MKSRIADNGDREHETGAERNHPRFAARSEKLYRRSEAVRGIHCSGSETRADGFRSFETRRGGACPQAAGEAGRACPFPISPSYRIPPATPFIGGRAPVW